MSIFNLFTAAFCSELQFLVCLKILNYESTKVAMQDAWTAYDRITETKGERKRTTTTKRYTSSSLKLVEEVTPQILSWPLNRLLFLRMSYFKWMHISKKWFSRFILSSGMKLEFLLLT